MSTRQLTGILAGSLAIAAIAVASGIAGDLDTGFGSGGVAVDTEFADIRGVAAVAGDAVIAVGAAQPDPDDFDFMLARYDSAGDLDTSFGTNGYVTPFGSDDGLMSLAAAVRADANGNFVAVGHATEETTRRKGKKTTTTREQKLALVRIDSDGDLDTSFGDSGAALTSATGSSSKLDAVAFQSDGSIVVVGTTYVSPPKQKGKRGGGGSSSPTSALLIARYDSDGKLDTSFGTDGFVIEDDTSANDFAGMNGIAVLSDDSIVVVGATAGIGWVRMYGADGGADWDVSLGSLQVLPSVAVDGSDRILVASGNGTDGIVERYDSNGDLDTGFASAGRYETALSDTTALRSINVLDSGDIVCAGQTFSSAGTVFTARLNPDGSADSGFGTSGISEETSPVSGSHQAFDLAVLSGGDYVICGNASGGLLARYCSE